MKSDQSMKLCMIYGRGVKGSEGYIRLSASQNLGIFHGKYSRVNIDPIISNADSKKHRSPTILQG